MRDDLTWFKSSHSDGDRDACIEVATDVGARVHVRDSKRATDAPHLTFTASSWSLFIAHTTAD